MDVNKITLIRKKQTYCVHNHTTWYRHKVQTYLKIIVVKTQAFLWDKFSKIQSISKTLCTLFAKAESWFLNVICVVDTSNTWQARHGQKYFCSQRAWHLSMDQLLVACWRIIIINTWGCACKKEYCLNVRNGKRTAVDN